MRFLIDNALSPVLARLLFKAGHDAIHLRDLHMQAAADEQVFDFAREQNRIVVSADTDFGFLLAVRRTTHPSVVLFRSPAERRPEKQAAVLLANLPSVAEALEQGSIVVLEKERVRVRRLPIMPGTGD